MKRIISLYTLLVLSLVTTGQTYLNSNEFEYMMPNQLGLYVNGDQSVKSVDVSLSFKSGYGSESARQDGISLLMYSYLLNTFSRDVNLIPGAVLQGELRENQTIFKFSLADKRYIPTLFSYMNAVFEQFEVDSLELEQAKGMAFKLAADMQQDRMSQIEAVVGPQLWGDFFPVYYPLATDSFLLAADSAALADYQLQHYCPGYALIMITGGVEHRDMRRLVMDSLTGWRDCRYSPANRQLLPSYKPTPLSRQNVVVTDVEQPTLMFFYQGPNLFNKFQVPFAAEALSGIFELPAFQQQLDSMGLSGLEYSFDVKKVAAQVVFSFTLNDTANIDSLTVLYRSFLDSLSVGKLVSKEMLDTVKSEMVTSMTTSAAGEKRYDLFRKFWAWSEKQWMKTAGDSIQKLKPKHIQQFVSGYLLQEQFVSALLLPDSVAITEVEEQYVSTTWDLDDYVFHFDKNTGNLDSASLASLNMLYQFMKVNPQMKVQVVGHADKDELGQVQDKKMLDFLEAHPGFEITEASLIPTKKIRLDIYRALVVTRYLIERGIPETQVSGTGLLLSDTFKTEQDRRKVFFLRKY